MIKIEVVANGVQDCIVAQKVRQCQDFCVNTI